MDFLFPQSRELVTSFLELVVALLALTVTFSEKLLSHATQTTRMALITCWGLLIVAALSAGIGLAMFGLAGLAAANGRTFWPLEPGSTVSSGMKDHVLFAGANVTSYSASGVLLVVVAGASFVFALGALAVVGVSTIRKEG